MKTFLKFVEAFLHNLFAGCVCAALFMVIIVVIGFVYSIGIWILDVIWRI